MLHDVEQQVNEVLMRDLEVHAFITSQAEARRLGAMALFGEKYGDEVRVVEVGDYARELCGGTHAARSGQLGLVKILSEASIGSGVRRVEALVGIDAFGFLARSTCWCPGWPSCSGCPASRSPTGSSRPSRSCATPRRSWRSCAPSWCSAAPAALAGQARDVRRRRVRRHRGAGGRGRQRRAHAGPGDPRQDRPGAAGGGRGGGPRPAARRRWSWRSTRRRKGRGLSAADLVKGALSGRGGGNADLAQGGGVPADQAPNLLAAVEKAVAEA